MTRRARGLRALGESVAKITGPIMSRQGFASGAIIAEWPAIVGEHMAARSIPEKVIHSRDTRDKNAGGTLRLCVASGGVATEFQHLEPLLLDRINTYFGYRAIARIQYVHRPLPLKAAPRPPASRPLTPEEERRLAEFPRRDRGPRVAAVPRRSRPRDPGPPVPRRRNRSVRRQLAPFCATGDMGVGGGG